MKFYKQPQQQRLTQHQYNLLMQGYTLTWFIPNVTDYVRHINSDS